MTPEHAVAMAAKLIFLLMLGGFLGIIIGVHLFCYCTGKQAEQMDRGDDHVVLLIAAFCAAGFLWAGFA